MEFEESEKKSLLLDILIDCEGYTNFDQVIGSGSHICIEPQMFKKNDIIFTDRVS